MDRSLVRGRIKVKITASAKSFSNNDGIAAYDNAAHTMWLVQNLPQFLQIEYPERQKITHYTILSPSSWQGDRSPKAWKLLGSKDGINWDLIDERSNQIKWNQVEEKKFILGKHAAYKYYRFIFTEVNAFGYFNDNHKYLGISEIVLFNGNILR